MGNKLFGIDVSGIINKEIGNRLTDTAQAATFIKVTPGTRTGNNTGGTNPTETNSTCKGFIDTQGKVSVDGTLVEDGDVVIVLIGDSISPAAVPESEDKVTIESVTYRIKVVDRDPAAATYTMICRAV